MTNQKFQYITWFHLMWTRCKWILGLEKYFVNCRLEFEPSNSECIMRIIWKDWKIFLESDTWLCLWYSEDNIHIHVDGIFCGRHAFLEDNKSLTGKLKAQTLGRVIDIISSDNDIKEHAKLRLHIYFWVPTIEETDQFVT
jgi:hypothetical protein